VVEQAVRRWAAALAASPAGQDVLQVGSAGSYARGDWGVGSDVDLVVLVAQAAQPVERRAAAWDTTALPVPADLVVDTPAEWCALLQTPLRPASCAGGRVGLHPPGT
jgi:predicted nucleotidyltransferase